MSIQPVVAPTPAPDCCHRNIESRLTMSLAAFHAGLADISIVSTLCPGGQERMRRLLNVVGSARIDLRALVTHRFALDHIEEAYDLFAHQRDGVIKVAITPA